jgi:hypothetical protein
VTRILYWNIENFALNKIQNPVTRKRKRGSSLPESAASAERFTYIAQHITDLDPDIFIIVEVETPYAANRGVLCVGSGAPGLLGMLGYLTGVNAAWSLVPALIAGNKEAVGVFFRSDRVQFTGPNLWAGGNGPTNAAVVTAAAAAYPAAWAAGLPGGATNAASAFNPGVAQNLCAAAVEFTTPLVMGVGGVAVNFGVGVRHPYQTTFWDIATNRDINIFTLHAPANTPAAQQFLTDMATADAISAAPGAAEVRLILGDFNLNLLDNATNLYTNCYAPLPAMYTPALMPLAAAPAPLLGYRGYYATHIRPTGNTRCWSRNASVVYYPAYAYSGDSRGANYESIDNVLYAGAVAAPQLTIANALVGSPYDNPGANPGGAPPGFAAVTQQLNWSWAGLNPDDPRAPNVAPQFAAARGIRGWFTGWDVYGKIRSTSDHLPLFFTC